MIRVFDQPNQGAEFYAIMGHYFAHRRYAKEMGGWQFYNDEGSTWFLLFKEDELAGFCAEFLKSTHVFWDNFFILPKWRGIGLSRELIDTRLVYSLSHFKEIRTITDNTFQMRNYERIGMQKNGYRGRYTRFILRPSCQDQNACTNTPGLFEAEPLESKQGSQA